MWLAKIPLFDGVCVTSEILEILTCLIHIQMYMYLGAMYNVRVLRKYNITRVLKYSFNKGVYYIKTDLDQLRLIAGHPLPPHLPLLTLPRMLFLCSYLIPD